MIRFIKIAPYELRPKGTDTFEYLTRLGLQEVDPSSTEPESLTLEHGTVLHSTLRRAVECIQPSSNVVLLPQDELREILFDLPKLCSREQWETEGSSAVRRGFVQSFIDDTLPVRREQLIDEIRYVLKESLSAEGPTTVISHSFRLKVIEAFIETRGRLAKEPGLLSNYISPEKKTYPFGGGFTAAEDDIRTALNN